MERHFYVLDYVVERKTADDLASSIMDGRYKEQKYRLFMSKIPNVYYLVEGKTTQSAMLPQQTVDKAMQNTYLMDQFKVKHTENLLESIKWLS